MVIVFIILLIDLDRFKDINDTLGHHIGDVVLQVAAGRLQHALREDDLVARLGGDEFGLLLPNTSLDMSTVIAKKILDAFHDPFIVEDHNLEIGLSIGISRISNTW